MDLFSGTGGFALGLLNAGFTFRQHYFCEVDSYAISNYQHNFKQAHYVGKIEKINSKGVERPNIISFGSPCQDISVASGGKGLSESKSRLFFDAIEIIKRFKPDCFVFENVRNILSSNQGKDFETVLRSISEIGLYDCQWQLLNSSLVLPQNRERLFLVAHLSEKSAPKVFPIQIDPKKTGEIREKESLKVTGKVYKSQQAGSVYHTSGKSPALMTDPSAFFIDNGKQVRKLTPIEAERLQGFPDNWTKYGVNETGPLELSDTQRYKLLGNAVSPKTFELIANQLEKSSLFSNGDFSLSGKVEDQQEINAQIEALIIERDLNNETYSEQDLQFIQRYEGSGGQASKGAQGQGLLHEFYTPEYVCDLMWQLARKHGYAGGKVLEPSCGTGRFIKYANSPSDVVGFEINSTALRIAEIVNTKDGEVPTLYSEYFETAFMQSPRFTTRLPKFQTWLEDYPFSLVIGNPPYGGFKSYYSSYFKKPQMPQKEHFFIYYGLQLLKKGGLLVYITSSSLLNTGSKYDKLREELDKICTLEEAFRLPPVFKFSQVPTDILIFKRK
ncbi:MAG: DNA (cytosine-5-)-methyltransferase [bacterium]|nr:DNA (cytosine-5-)-methyltransferase [bacterium]